MDTTEIMTPWDQFYSLAAKQHVEETAITLFLKDETEPVFLP